MNFSSEVQALLSLHGLTSLFILSALELVLGVDNIIFISLTLNKLPAERRFKARVLALSLAFLMRLTMLFCIVWLSGITTALFTLFNFNISIQDILFFTGGAYLIFNTVKELVNKDINKEVLRYQMPYKSVILQIVLIDILFSFDSIFTAIGLIPNFIIMALAIAIGMLFMIYLSGKTSAFIEKHPSVKKLALYFIIMVGLMLLTQAFHIEIHKGYLYVALVILIIIEGFKTQVKNKKA